MSNPGSSGYINHIQQTSNIYRLMSPSATSDTSLPYSKEKLQQNIGIVFSNQISLTALSDTDSTKIMKDLQARLGYPYRFVSHTSLMRIRAKQKNKTFDQFIEYCRDPENRSEAQWVQLQLLELGKQNWQVIKSPIAHVAMPRGFKVLINRKIEYRAEARARERQTRDIAAMREEIENEDRLELAFLSKELPGSIWPRSDFDYIVEIGPMETTSANVAAGTIAEAHDAWLRMLRDRHVAVIDRAIYG